MCRNICGEIIAYCIYYLSEALAIVMIKMYVITRYIATLGLISVVELLRVTSSVYMYVASEVKKMGLIYLLMVRYIVFHLIPRLLRLLG